MRLSSQARGRRLFLFPGVWTVAASRLEGFHDIGLSQRSRLVDCVVHPQKLSGSQSQFWTGRGLGLVVLAGEGEHAFVMKLPPIDLSCLEELAHLLTGPMKPCLERT